jgi:protein TonB
MNISVQSAIFSRPPNRRRSSMPIHIEHLPPRISPRCKRMVLCSLALHVLLFAWIAGPRKLAAPERLIALSLQLVNTPSSPVLRQEARQRAPTATPLARPLVKAERATHASVAPTATTPPEARQLPLPSAPSPAAEASGAVRPTTSPEAKSNPAPAADQQHLLGRYAQQLAHLLSNQQSYPRLAALRGWEGEVRLRLRVARKGNLLAIDVDRSSGYDILDQHARQLVDASSPLPALPDEVIGGEIQITVPVSYKLRKTT